jgi:hypothetical protein
MKKSQFIKLVLVAAALNSCNSNNQWEEPQKKIYMRSDSTAKYSHVQGGFHGGYLPFIAYGIWRNNQYARAGYFSSALPQSANIGTNPFKSNIVRGGFGSSVYKVSS